MNKVYLLLGSNEGERINWLKLAMEALITTCGKLIQHSSVYETAAWGLKEQPDFLNMVIELETSLTPLTLLKKIQQIEKNCGRQRKIKWGQRTLDMDILFYNQEVIDTDELKIPHPFLQERRFTLEPLCEIAPTLIHPVLQQSVTTLLEHCTDPLSTRKSGRGF